MNNLFSLKNEVAVVTGALGKLGSIWIEALLDAGASVFALDLEGAKVSDEFSKLQVRFDEGRLKLARTDVRDRQSLEDVCSQCIASFGTPGILVNNAGIDRPPANSAKVYRLEEIPFDENREIFEVNTLGLFLVAQVFGSRMVKAGRGSPDEHFYDHIPGFLKPPAYGASKAAVINLTRYLSTHWAPHGVRVNALSPGGVLGGQDEEFKRKFCDRVPMGRMATAEDLHGPLLFLASPASVYVTGTELMVDGGFTAW